MVMAYLLLRSFGRRYLIALASRMEFRISASGSDRRQRQPLENGERLLNVMAPRASAVHRSGYGASLVPPKRRRGSARPRHACHGKAFDLVVEGQEPLTGQVEAVVSPKLAVGDVDEDPLR
jgi:hypothetical protein